jgi:membrane-bound serine protease (ClpP class)
MSILIGLLVAGYVLILAELVLPGMISGILGAVCLVVAVLYAATAEPFAGTNLWAYILLAEIVSGCVLFWLWMKFFFKSSIGKRFVIQNDADARQEEEDYDHRYGFLVGQTGEAVTALHPSGVARFQGKRYDVVTEGGLIEKDDQISVVKTEGARIVVRRSFKTENTENQPLENK